MNTFPQSIAIAGAWGYIGRQFLDAALNLGLRVSVYDPGPAPADVDLSAVVRCEDERSFYRRDADLFHLALHPEHRQIAFEVLLERASKAPLLVLNEKPMAQPEDPAQCAAVQRAIAGSQAVVLYDFLELFDPMVHAIFRYLSGFEQVEITGISLYRGKDREDPRRPRNYKRMVHIQYQELVHCMAFLLALLGNLRGSPAAVFVDGVSVTAQAQPYAPPNPQDYPYVVDGRCCYAIELGKLRIDGCTDFKSGAEFAKRKIIRGRADGREFVIEADTQEGRKYLRIDGRDQGFAPDASSYAQALLTLGEWYRKVASRQLMTGVYPNPQFAHLTYQLSSLLWKSSQCGAPVQCASADELLAFDAGFASAATQFPRYPG